MSHKPIVEISGLDYTGKSTQAEMLSMETWRTHVHNFGSFGKYDERLSTGLTPQEHFNWWFRDASADEVGQALADNYVNRNRDIESSSDIDVAVAERGRAMLIAQIAAIYAVRLSIEPIETIEQSSSIVEAKIKDKNADRTELLLVKDDSWMNSNNKISKYLRRMDSSAAGVFTKEQNEHYQGYLRKLEQSLGLIANSDAIHVIPVDRPGVDVQNVIRDHDTMAGYELPKLIAQELTAIGLAGLSESGKSAIAQALNEKHGFSRIKIGFFNESNRNPNQRYASPTKMALDIVHFIATNRHFDNVSFESLFGPRLAAELKTLLGDRWLTVLIKAEEQARQDRLLQQFPQSDTEELAEEQRVKDMVKSDAGLAAYEEIADIVIDNDGTLDEAVDKLVRAVRSGKTSAVVRQENRERNDSMALHGVERLKQLGRTVEAGERPKRCRTIVFNPAGDKVLGIERNRPNRDIYTVYPGGGLEEADKTAKHGAYRELKEELDLGQWQVALTDYVLEHEDELFFIGVARKEFGSLRIHGPESERDRSESGTYTPKWIPVQELRSADMFPEEITEKVISAVVGQ